MKSAFLLIEGAKGDISDDTLYHIKEDIDNINSQKNKETEIFQKNNHDRLNNIRGLRGWEKLSGYFKK